MEIIREQMMFVLSKTESCTDSFYKVCAKKP